MGRQNRTRPSAVLAACGPIPYGGMHVSVTCILSNWVLQWVRLEHGIVTAAVTSLPQAVQRQNSWVFGAWELTIYGMLLATCSWKAVRQVWGLGWKSGLVPAVSSAVTPGVSHSPNAAPRDAPVALLRRNRVAAFRAIPSHVVHNTRQIRTSQITEVIDQLLELPSSNGFSQVKLFVPVWHHRLWSGFQQNGEVICRGLTLMKHTKVTASVDAYNNDTHLKKN